MRERGSERADRPASNSSRDRIEPWRSALKAVGLLSEELPKERHQDLSEAAARIGSILYSLKACSDAADAYRLAYKLGRPRFLTRNRLFFFTAAIFGPLAAERIGTICRKMARYMI